MPEESIPESRLRNDSLSLQQTQSMEQRVSLLREVVVVGIISLAQFTTQVGLGQALAILHIITQSLDVASAAAETWAIAGYSLTVGTFILFSGRLGDVFGYKLMLIVGFAWYSVFSLVAGSAVYSNYTLFVFARVLQGIGPSICLPNGLALLGILYKPGRRKSFAFAIFGSTAPAGCIVGATFAGIFGLAWWPWTFWSFAIVLAATAVLCALVIPERSIKGTGERLSLLQVLTRLDALGALIGGTALILFNFAWNQAPVSGWNASFVIATLIIGLALVVVFFWIELRVSSHPLIPFSAMTSEVAFVLACIACGWASFGIWIYYTFQQLQVLRGSSPLLCAAYLSPLVPSGIVAALTTGLVSGRIRPAWIMLTALCAFLVGNILITTAPVQQVYWAQLFVATLVIPWGMDMSFPAATLIMSNAVSEEAQGVAASLVTTFVNYSISLGVGFAGTVETQVNRGGHNPEDILRGYRGAFYMSIGLAGLGVGISGVFVARSYLKVQPEVDEER